MVKRQGLDDIIRDAMNSINPKKKLAPKKLRGRNAAQRYWNPYDPFGRSAQTGAADNSLKNIPYNQRKVLQSKAKRKKGK